jgi:hypothetical protein
MCIASSNNFIRLVSSFFTGSDLNNENMSFKHPNEVLVYGYLIISGNRLQSTEFGKIYILVDNRSTNTDVHAMH